MAPGSEYLLAFDAVDWRAFELRLVEIVDGKTELTGIDLLDAASGSDDTGLSVSPDASGAWLVIASVPDSFSGSASATYSLDLKAHS